MKKLKKLAMVITTVAIGISAVGCSSTDTKLDENQVTSNVDQNTDQNTDLDVAVAKVGEAEITEAQVQEELFMVEQYLMMFYGEDFMEDETARTIYEQQRLEIIDYLIETELLLQDARAKGLTVDQEELDEALEEVVVATGGQEVFEQMLELQGLTEETFRVYIEDNLLIMNAIQDIIADVEVDASEVEAYYEENKEWFIKEAGADMAHILVDTEEEAIEVRDRYEAGEAFEDLAMEVSLCSSAAAGGDLGGFISYNSAQYDVDFLEGAQGLEEGEVSEPVLTQFGYHLIKVTNVQAEDVQLAFEEVEADIIGMLQDEEEYLVFSEYMATLRENADVEIY